MMLFYGAYFHEIIFFFHSAVNTYLAFLKALKGFKNILSPASLF